MGELSNCQTPLLILTKPPQNHPVNFASTGSSGPPLAFDLKKWTHACRLGGKVRKRILGIVTALTLCSAEKAMEMAVEAYKSGKGILEIIREKKTLTEAQLKELHDPVKLTGLDKSKYQKNVAHGAIAVFSVTRFCQQPNTTEVALRME